MSGDRDEATGGASEVPAGGATSSETEDGPSSEHGGARGRLLGHQRTALGDVANRLDLSTGTIRFLVAVTVVGLLARLAWLGARGAHYDEGRVGYWVLRYAKTGHFEYRYIIHGPLVQHVDRWLFALVGPSDFVARLPVALVGAALPLVVLLYRDHLDDVELAGMAAILGLNPILLYYSRFMRSDLLVATFMLAALGALLRLHATRRPRYLYAVALFGALGFASKENAIVYVLCWLGASALLVEGRLFRPEGHATGIAMARSRGRALIESAGSEERRLAPWVRRGSLHVAGAGGLFLLVTFLLFAPRAGSVGGPGLWRIFVDPTHLPAVVRATAVDLGYGFGYWFGGAADAGCRKDTLVEGYACYLWRMTTTVAQFATATAVLAALGFVRERYAVADSRPLVMFAGFWGVASFFGYPLGTDIWSAWVVTHVVVPLSIPAAAGFAALVRVGGEGIATDREDLVVVPAIVLLALGGWTGAVAVEEVYLDDSTREHPGDMVQYAQPERDVKQAVAAMQTAVATSEDGVDLLYHGRRFYVSDESVAEQPPIPQSENHWFDRLPMPWYGERMDATVASTQSVAALDSRLESRPPVVVATANGADDVRTRVTDYRQFSFDLRAHTDGPSRGTSVVVFVDERRLD